MKILVTGGTGFLGGAVCRQLRARGDEVVSFARSRSDMLDRIGVVQVQGEISALDKVIAASQGCDAIIHTAAKAGIWGPLAEFTSANVGGTLAVLGACELNGIRKLVYTSTPSVVHAGGDIEGGDESLPYASHFAAHYPATKAVAERHVLEANGPKLATVALRPHLIWGPGDHHLLPRILKRQQQGRLRFIGKPKQVDTVYVENAAEAHLAALDRLEVGAACAGKAYFISQGQPIALDDMINKMLKACGRLPETRRIPVPMARLAGFVFESWYSLTGRTDDPPMTRFLAEQLSTAHWFDISAARRDLGYQPRVTLAEGLVRLGEWWMREGKHQA